MKGISLLRQIEAHPLLFQMMGPLFLLATISLSLPFAPAPNYDLALVSILGLILCAREGLRGCGYALLLLACSIFFKHIQLDGHHAWQFVAEASVGFSLLISALTSQEGKLFLRSLEEKVEARDQTIQQLEQEIDQTQEAFVQEKGEILGKHTQLLETFDEAQSELSSLQVLNEVLRKTSAAASVEKDALVQADLQSRHKVGQLFQEINELQKELSRLGNESGLAAQNKQLFHELNEARFKEAQTHLINETLVRLHAQESQRAGALEGQASIAQRQLEKTIEQLHEARERGSSLEQLAAERLFLKERLQHAEAELAVRPETVVVKSDGETGHLLEQMAELREHLAASAQIEPLYRQLREQFEEKNQVLHETRAMLFRSDTELQTLRAEVDEQALKVDPVPPTVRQEIDALAGENRLLVDEVAELQSLVSHLMAGPVVKKK